MGRGPIYGTILALPAGAEKITKTSIMKLVVGVLASILTAIFPNKSEATQFQRTVPLQRRHSNVFRTFSLRGVFLTTLILYVCTTVITLNQPRIFMKFTTDRNFQSSPINDMAGAANMGILQPQLASLKLPRQISNRCIHL